MAEFSVDNIAYLVFVFLCRVMSVFCFCVDGYQMKLLHDAANSSSGDDDVFRFQFTFYLACAIDISACTKDGTNLDLQLDGLIGKGLWSVIIGGTANA